MKILALIAAGLLFAGIAQAAGVEKVGYEIDGTSFESLLVDDGSGAAGRPGLLVIPNWLGINDTAIARAKELAGDRYVVLLVDMYGVETRPQNFEQAGAASGAVLSDRALTRTRINRAVDALREAGADRVDPRRIAAIGFCFGGTVALELARSGAAVAAVVSMHGNPGPELPVADTGIQAGVLVLHGAADRYVPDEALRGFEREMEAADADWLLASFGGAVHCFAEPEADDTPPGCKYDARAARRAYALTDAFLGERLSARR